jgi:hypothetical protein
VGWVSKNPNPGDFLKEYKFKKKTTGPGQFFEF